MLILKALTFVLAPLPNALFSHCGGDDFSGEENSGPVDLGRFITSLIVVTGFALPIVLAHSEVILSEAAVMSIIGGGCVTFVETFPSGVYGADLGTLSRLVYGTILSYSAAFRQEDSDYD